MSKTYDALLIFAGSLKDEALEKTLERVNAEIERLGGSIVAIENLGRHSFARTLKKRENGVYAKVTFQLDPANVAALRTRYRMSEDVFRAQIRVRDEKFETRKTADRKRRAAYRATLEAAAQASGESSDNDPDNQ